MLGKLVHLKCFAIHFADKSRPLPCPQYITDPLQIFKCAADLPKLEVLSVRHCYTTPRDLANNKTKEDRPVLKKKEKQLFPSNIHKLSWPLDQLFLFKSYVKFDSVTFFEAVRAPYLRSTKVALPHFRNLDTLVLTRCTWLHIDAILKHCVAYSPGLVSLIIKDSSGEVPEAKLSKYLAQIRHAEVYETNLSFQLIVQNAPELRHLVYHSYLNGAQLNWLEQHISKQGTRLNKIEFLPGQPRNTYCDSVQKWCQSQKVEVFVETPYSHRGILEKVVTGDESGVFVLDVQGLLKKIRGRFTLSEQK